jgi:hypothetical protein
MRDSDTGDTVFAIPDATEACLLRLTEIAVMQA